MPTKKSNPSSKPKQPKSEGSSAANVPEAPIVPAALATGAASYASFAIKPDEYDPEVAATLTVAWQPWLATLAPAELAVPRLDVRSACLSALAVHAFVTQIEPLRARFEKLHAAGELEIKNLDRLKELAFVGLHAFREAESAGAFKTDIRVPADVAKQAKEVEKRMQTLCEYKFSKDREVAPKLDQLRPGTGHLDTADDLLGYAEIYVLRADDVATDTTNYVATDLADARRLAGEILSHLAAGMTPKAREAYERLRRAWTALLRVHFEIRQVGLCLLRHDPSANEWFPSLFSAGRTPRGKGKAKKNDKAPVATETPVDG